MRTVPLRRLAHIVNGGTPKGDASNWDGDVPWATPVDLGTAHGGELSDTLRTLTDKGLETGSSAVPAGSVLLSTRAPVGYVAIATQRMAFNQGCKALVPDKRLNSRYLAYALQASTANLHVRSNGTTFLELSTEALKSTRIPYLTVPKQVQIADFLDRETAQIDAMIEAQERVVHLSQEHRAAVVAQTLEAVETGGAPTVPLRYCLMVQSGVTLGHKPSEDDEEYPYLRVANVQTGWLDLDVIKTVRVAPDVARRAMLRTGDVLITEGGDRTALGRGALWRGEIPGALHQNHIFALRCRDCLDPSFLVYVLDAPAARVHFESTRRQTTNLSSTNTAKVKAFKTPLPPVTRQKEVVAELDGALESVNEVIAAAQRVTILLRERREALITAAVSGRIDPTTGIERIEEAS